MKAWKVILNILAVLAAVAGAIYALATYGDKIVAWCKELLNKLDGLCCCKNAYVDEDIAVAEEADETAIEAEDKDFEG